MQVDPLIPTESVADEAEEAERQAQIMVVDAVIRSPYRKPIAAADALVSVLLMWAGVALFRRKESARWWVTQAAIANGLLAVIEASTQWLAIDAHWQDILGTDPQVGLAAANAALTTLALTTVARVALYGWFLYRVRRPDIQAALAEA